MRTATNNIMRTRSLYLALAPSSLCLQKPVTAVHVQRELPRTATNHTLPTSSLPDYHDLAALVNCLLPQVTAVHVQKEPQRTAHLNSPLTSTSLHLLKQVTALHVRKELPRTATNKVMRRALRDELMAAAARSKL